MNTNDLIKIIVTVTMCLALLGVIGLAYLGKVETSVIVTFVLTTFASLAGGAGGVALTQYGNKTGVTTALNILRAEQQIK